MGVIDEIEFKHKCVNKTVYNTFLVRVKDGPKEKCLGTYATEKEALDVANQYRKNRLIEACESCGHSVDDGAIVEDNYLIFDNGDLFVIDTGCKMHPGINGAGYYSSVLNGKNCRIHRLVAENFIPNKFNLPCVNHIDGNKLNNDVSNLEWCTQSHNVKHAFLTGLKTPAIRRGEECPWSKLTWDDVHYIRNNYIPFDRVYGQTSLAKKFGVCQETIRKILNHRLWPEEGDVKKEMNIPEKIEPLNKPFLYDYQMDAVNRMRNGCVLCGSVGSGKSRTALFWYFKECGGWIDENGYKPMTKPKDLYIITTAKKCSTKEWNGELANFLLYPDENNKTRYGNTIIVNSWNQMHKYENAENSIFIFDEQRLVSYGSWAKTFLNIAKKNRWVLLSGTPGDSYMEYLPLFLANGFFQNKSEFIREHVKYARYTKYPKIEGYYNTTRLDRLRDRILVTMDYKHDINAHHEDIRCDYDVSMYHDAIRKRWDPFKNEPITQASGLCYTLRRIVNSDQSRQVKLLEILEKHPKAIIFYNFTYELEILRNLAYGEDVEIAEYNGEKHQDIPSGSKWVYLVQYNAGCEGWSCIRTNCTIFFSQNYSYKIIAQAAGRIDRLNTPYTDLYYYHLRSRSGIDLAISKALMNKKKFNERKFAGWNK